MKFSFVSLFCEILYPYFEYSILARAKARNLISTDFFNPRDFSKDVRKKVDSYKIGGGAGLLMQVEPLCECLEHIHKSNSNTHFVFLNPAGKPFTQKDAKRLAKKEHICFVCGRYEGIDERVLELFANEVFSLGSFVLTGGELAALCMSDAISRNINGVLGNSQSLDEESFEDNLLEAPSFAKPFSFNYKNENLNTTSAFLKGNHGKIIALKKTLSLAKTKFFNPTLYQKYLFCRYSYQK